MLAYIVYTAAERERGDGQIMIGLEENSKTSTPLSRVIQLSSLSNRLSVHHLLPSTTVTSCSLMEGAEIIITIIIVPLLV